MSAKAINVTFVGKVDKGLSLHMALHYGKVVERLRDGWRILHVDESENQMVRFLRHVAPDRKPEES